MCDINVYNVWFIIMRVCASVGEEVRKDKENSMTLLAAV